MNGKMKNRYGKIINELNILESGRHSHMTTLCSTTVLHCPLLSRSTLTQCPKQHITNGMLKHKHTLPQKFPQNIKKKQWKNMKKKH